MNQFTSEDYVNMDSDFRSLEHSIAFKLEKLREYASHMESIESTYKDVVKKGSRFMEEYADAVDTHTRICAMLSSVSQTLIDMREMRSTVRQLKGQSKAIQQYQARIERIVMNLGDLKNAIEPVRDAYEKRLRFYNSCQYTLTEIQC